MSTQIFTWDWAGSETGGNMGLVKDINPYDSDCNNLPSAGILSPGVFHTRNQRLLLWKMCSWEASWLHSIPVSWNMLDDAPCVMEAPQGLCQHCLHCDGVGREKKEGNRTQRRKQNWVGLTTWVFSMRQGHNIAWPFVNLNLFRQRSKIFP